jgi:hypothetical protein
MLSTASLVVRWDRLPVPRVRLGVTRVVFSEAYMGVSSFAAVSGVVVWEGTIGEHRSLGVVMDRERPDLPLAGDGTVSGRRIFECPGRYRAAFLPFFAVCEEPIPIPTPAPPPTTLIPTPALRTTAGVWVCPACTLENRDSDFLCEACETPRHAPRAREPPVSLAVRNSHDRFGPDAEPRRRDPNAPLPGPPLVLLRGMCGRWRGIQGKRSSCALDAVLFSLFAATSVVDHLLQHPGEGDDPEGYALTRRVILREVVLPLRTAFYVPFEGVMKVRALLSELGLVPLVADGTMEKDAEEFLHAIMKLLMCESLFELVPRSSIHLRHVIDAAAGESPLTKHHLYTIICGDGRSAAPRRYAALSDLLSESLAITGMQLATCPTLFAVQVPRSGQGRVFDAVVPPLTLDLPHLRTSMRLTAIIAIQSSHYVVFARFGSSSWVFADSMSDSSEDALQNIPEVKECPINFHLGLERPDWVIQNMNSNIPIDPMLERACRDNYICFFEKL